jgi:hypothetical protein
MYDPVQDVSTSTATSLSITWSALTLSSYTGGSAITSYKLEWDQGTSTWAILVGDPVGYTSLSYTSSGLTAGTSYKYRLTAQNVYGWGVVSNEVTMTPLGVPSIPDPVTTSVVATNVKIEWTDPTITNGAAITSY